MIYIRLFLLGFSVICVQLLYYFSLKDDDLGSTPPLKFRMTSNPSDEIDKLFSELPEPQYFHNQDSNYDNGDSNGARNGVSNGDINGENKTDGISNIPDADNSDDNFTNSTTENTSGTSDDYDINVVSSSEQPGSSSNVPEKENGLEKRHEESKTEDAHGVETNNDNDVTVVKSDNNTAVLDAKPNEKEPSLEDTKDADSAQKSNSPPAKANVPTNNEDNHLQSDEPKNNAENGDQQSPVIGAAKNEAEVGSSEEHVAIKLQNDGSHSTSKNTTIANEKLENKQENKKVPSLEDTKDADSAQKSNSPPAKANVPTNNEDNHLQSDEPKNNAENGDQQSPVISAAKKESEVGSSDANEKLENKQKNEAVTNNGTNTSAVQAE